MDSSYLHKKFKKQQQQCVEPKSQNVQSDKKPVGVATPPSVQNKENRKESGSPQQVAARCGEVVHDREYDNNSVPITRSTNNQSNLDLSVLPPSSYSSYSFVKSSISDVGNLERTDKVLDTNDRTSSWSGEGSIADAFQPPNNGISYVVSNQSKSALAKQPNFDTKINDYEPTPSTSSILESLYSKNYYVTSKLVNFIKSEEAASGGNSIDKNYYGDDAGECKGVEKKDSDGSTPDKASVGGKYVCNYCNLVCSKPSVLQKHIRAHTNERPFPCISCGFSFKTRSNLYKHCRSRTHANRVMGNKAQEITNEMMDVDSQIKVEYPNHVSPNNHYEEMVAPREEQMHEKKIVQDVKQKPYKPRFKVFFDGISKENAVESKQSGQTKTSSPDLLSLHISELIHKNNSIVNSSDAHLLRKRSVDNYYVDSANNNEYLQHKYNNDNAYLPNDEPLNLTNKNRKRCLSEITEPTAQKSLIKELLLKNLYADTNKQCPYCKMIFQTVTELDLHKLRSCKGFTKTGARYSRSSSVNVASILTQNKNAFDTNPHVPNTVFPLKSPGPFLGKTRLVESDKAKSFSFEDGIQTTFQSSSPSFQGPELMRSSQRYSLSPLTLHTDKTRKFPVKLFGGEVKITHTSGETKSFKIDAKDDDASYEYGSKLSENRVVKSILQSGGTVLQNKPAYSKQDARRSSPDVIRVYENTSVSPSIDIVTLEKTKFNFERQGQDSEHAKVDDDDGSHRTPVETNASNLEKLPSSSSSSSYKYTNILDFSQKAVKLFAPNLKQPNLAIPGLPVPNKLAMRLTVDTKTEKPFEVLARKQQLEHTSPRSAYAKEPEATVKDFPPKQVWLEQKTAVELPPKVYSSSTCNPMNLLVNGKVVRYVPGIPGPIVAEAPLDMVYSNSIVATSPRHSRLPKPNIKITPVEASAATAPPPRSPFVENYSPKSTAELTCTTLVEKNKSPKLSSLEVKVEGTLRTGELRSPKLELRSPTKTSGDSSKSPVVKSPPNSNEAVAARKFARPNSLALKPSMSGLKQHHGLTPTMFNQILISPDTPRVAKKYNHQILHGNYFSYLGLKSSTKSVYCTLNKTQPFYVPHFKKLSMYSEWRQQDNKSDKLYVSAYDSRQKQQKYSTAGQTTADLIVHSSYKFTITEIPSAREESAKSILLGGYESNEDYTYVRGRGRGRYVCDQCGIRCKKPSMLKKHIRTHSNDRPYTCGHCNFSFKTKGNLTKHMKSKAHTKNSAANSSSSNSSAQQSGTPSSDSDTDDSGMDSSDESTRQQEHEAAYGLLSLSQKPASGSVILSQNERVANLSQHQNSSSSISLVSSETLSGFMDTEQIAHVTKTNYAKNKILDQQTNRNFNTSKFSEVLAIIESDSHDSQHMMQFLGKSNTNRPLTYPYTSDTAASEYSEVKCKTQDWEENFTSEERKHEPKSIKQFNVVKRYNNLFQSLQEHEIQSHLEIKHVPKYETNKLEEGVASMKLHQPAKTLGVVEKLMLSDSPQSVSSELRKRKVSMDINNFTPKLQKNDSEVIDLSMSSSNNEKKLESQGKPNGFMHVHPHLNENEIRTVTYVNSQFAHNNKFGTNTYQIDAGDNMKIYNSEQHHIDPTYATSDYNELITKSYLNKGLNKFNHQDDTGENFKTSYSSSANEDSYRRNCENVNRVDDSTLKVNDVQMDVDESSTNYLTLSESPKSIKHAEYDNSAMETLADIATKQVKLEKNSIAKNVATEFLILATKNEYQNRDSNSFISGGKDMNELIVKPEENKNCTICSKSFIKPSQLRLHMNIHYLERPFRCDSCSVSFRTKGHLQKHERSAGHHNKLSSSPTLSSSEPRPFKCSDCNIAFRIHGHLAKHLRSKMHIMKLECLAKIPFGLYAELERSNSLLTEINTTDGDQCLESLKMLAKKVFVNDPNKLNQMGPSSIESIIDTDS